VISWAGARDDLHFSFRSLNDFCLRTALSGYLRLDVNQGLKNRIEYLVATMRRRPIFSRNKIQGCQMVCFLTKNPNLGKFWRVLQWKMLVYFMDTWSILRYFVICILLTFDPFYGILLYFIDIWNFCGNLVYFSRFGILNQVKSGNPEQISANSLQILSFATTTKRNENKK
jgi:hypothetical protein